MSDDFDAFDVVPLGQHGGRRAGSGRPRKGEVRQKNSRVSLKRYGNNPDYICARLLRDRRFDLLEGVRSGKISAYAAAEEMNYIKRPEPLGTGSENAAKRRAWAMHRLLNPRPNPKTLIG
jgi:hypothetical protein